MLPFLVLIPEYIQKEVENLNGVLSIFYSKLQPPRQKTHHAPGFTSSKDALPLLVIEEISYIHAMKVSTNVLRPEGFCKGTQEGSLASAINRGFCGYVRFRFEVRQGPRPQL